MVITRYSNQFFKLQFGDITVAVNPVSKDSSYKASKFGADICLITTNHPDMNGADQVSFGEKQAFVVTGPGEYEIKEVFIKGFLSKSTYGGEERVNTIYTLNLDSMNICFLGALEDINLSSEAKEALDDIDILFAPIGGKGTLDAAAAYKLAVQLEPKVIIPMGYDTEKEALKTFLKEGGDDSVKPTDKLTVKKKDLDGKEGEIIVLSSQA